MRIHFSSLRIQRQLAIPQILKPNDTDEFMTSLIKTPSFSRKKRRAAILREDSVTTKKEVVEEMFSAPPLLSY